MIIQTSRQSKGLAISYQFSYSDYILGLEHCDRIIEQKKIELIKAFLDTGWFYRSDSEHFVDLDYPEKEIKSLEEPSSYRGVRYYYNIYGEAPNEKWTIEGMKLDGAICGTQP